jgi:HAD superfamily hydrolase (TIGR01509 family)
VDAPPIELVLFDLGGVLVDFGGVESMKAMAGIESDDELWERWLTCRWVRKFERGHCSPDQFAAGMVEDWQLALSPNEYVQAFSSWIGGTLPGAHELVVEVRQLVPIGCLSNTNQIHWEAHFSQWPLVTELDHRFLSFEVGAVKPDREVFALVAAATGVRPERTFFLDDNQLNVDGASAFGFRSVRVKGVDEARRALVEAGLLAE